MRLVELDQLVKREFTDNVAVQHKKWLVILGKNIAGKRQWA